jgi:predicted molibdopterin-dependent oxidoreductase YjgC
VPSTCSYCGVGCGLFLNVKGGRLISASPDLEDEASSGYLCVRGQFGYDYAANRERLKTPLIRRGDELTETTWDEALDATAAALARIVREHGPDAVGVIGSGKTTTEEAYLVQKLARAVLGTNNVDHPSGQLYQSPTIEALRRAFGIPAMTMPTADLEKSGCILVVGSNTMETHPVLFFKVQKAVRRGARLILIDPKESTPRRFASTWLRVRPGGDVAAINGMLRVILDDNLVDQAFVEANVDGYAELAAQLAESTVEGYAETAGVAVDELRMAAHLFASGGTDKRYPIPDSWYGMFVTPGQRPETRSSAIIYAGGLVHHPNAVDGVQALANLALVTGMIGKEGAGLCPLAGHNNTQGACDVGVLPNYWPGYAPVGEAEAAARLGTAWGTPPPATPGKSLVEMLEAARTGALKALLVVGANPARSAPGVDDVEEALQRLDFLAVSDIFPHHTSRRAHVVFPAAVAAEKDGTFTNTERRVQRVRAALPPVGLARPDWYILSELANRVARNLGKPATFDYAGPGDVLAEIARVVPFYGGISYQKIENGGIQWPCPSSDHPGTRYLFADGFGDHKARVIPVRASPPPTDTTYPFLLSIGRAMQFNTGVISDHSRRLSQMREKPAVEINPADAAEQQISDGDSVRVTSAHGSLDLVAAVTKTVRPGQLFLYLHHAEAPANRLTAADSVGGGMPELKAVPVRIGHLSQLPSAGATA